jgi:hypothetical protein
MGIKSVFSKIGKVLLTAAPYIAAPFTGGASLLATGLANKGVQKWSERDANKKIAKGLAPSKFDAALGKVGNIAGMASMFIPGGQLGMLGKAGSIAGDVGKVAGSLNTASKLGKVGSVLANVGKGAIGLGGAGIAGKIGQTVGPAAIGSIFGNRGSNQAVNNQVLSPYTGQSSFADALSAGRNAAYASQPWRIEPQLPIYDPKKKRQLY